MPNLHDTSKEIKAGHRAIRLRYAASINEITGRNVIAYYSGWLQKPKMSGISVDDMDTNAFMSAIHNLNRKKGLDIILHTPGGGVAATESIVNYLRSMFGTDIRVIVPHLALSAGTMIACAAKTIIMGKHSSLGPIDPQIQGMAAHGVVLEFERAYEEIKNASDSEILAKKAIWLPIISKYPPAFLGACEQSIEWAKEMACAWLESGMFINNKKAKQKAESIVKKLTDHALTKSHDRHLSFDYCKNKIKLSVVKLEKNSKLQDAVLSFHHAYMLTFMETDAIKIIENHKGVSFMLRNSPQK